MSEPDLETLAKPVVGNITLPVEHGTYLALKPNIRTDPNGPTARYPVSIAGIDVPGRWIVVGLREDYALTGNRRYWVTLEWTQR
jgi:hypothetical protein